VRGLVIGQEQGLLQTQKRLLLLMPEQGPHKGQALAQLSGIRCRRRSDT
jgi:hypothetical protein